MNESVRCSKVRCRGRITFHMNGYGKLIERCEQCERRKRGICRDCPKPVRNPQTPTCFYCADCKHARVLETARLMNHRHHEKQKARKRAYYMKKRTVLLAKLREKRHKVWETLTPEQREYRERLSQGQLKLRYLDPEEKKRIQKERRRYTDARRGVLEEKRRRYHANIKAARASVKMQYRKHGEKRRAQERARYQDPVYRAWKQEQNRKYRAKQRAKKLQEKLQQAA